MLSILAVIPARQGSKGLPGKALRPLCDMPLIAHSILCARRCGLVPVVTTDGPDIAREAVKWDADVIMRPAKLCTDEAPLWPTIRHALSDMEREHRGRPFDYVLLLDPSSPGRLPSDVASALALLEDRGNADADGILGVHKSEWSPYWHMVKQMDGVAVDLFPGATTYDRRQDVPDVYCINASLYLWRASFVRSQGWSWRYGRHLLWPIPAIRALHIDDEVGLQHAQAVIDAGLVQLPWVNYKGDHRLYVDMEGVKPWYDDVNVI